MNGLLIFVIIVVALAAVGGGVWLWMRHRYISAIEERGWTWVESPDMGITTGLNHAPFGIGFRRKVDDQVLGRGPRGIAFQAFRYTSDAFHSSGYVLTMKLPKSLPSVAASHPERPRIGTTGAQVSSTPLHVVAQRPDFGQEFGNILVSAVPALLDSQHEPAVLDVGVDHNQLVMLHVPRAPADLALAVAWLEDVHHAITASNAMAFEGSPPPSHLSFQDRDHWEYRENDDSMLSYVSHTGGGFDHRAEDVILSDNDGLPFIRLTHRWKTRHTRTNSKGNTTTYVKNHTEDIAEFRTTFPFRQVSVNWGVFKGFGGNRVEFESSAFNQMFKVRCAVPRFASDVFHPRQMEYFLRTGAPGFSIEADGAIRVEGGNWSPAELDRASEFFHGFFSRVPDFAWQELGAWPRPIPEIGNYSA
ncbi:MAG: hypothetical protein ACTHU1_13990 [Arachnia sp.]